MKAPILLRVTIFSLAIGSFISVASAGFNRHRTDKTLVQDEEERYVMVTGSHLPQRIKVKSIGTNTPYNLRIYTRRELESTGRFTPGEALTIDPSIQLSRH